MVHSRPGEMVVAAAAAAATGSCQATWIQRPAASSSMRQCYCAARRSSSSLPMHLESG